jgi:hypothetical protein
MKRPVVETSGQETEATGLPFFRTWKGVYLLVLGSFILWVTLLITLTRTFS